MSLIERYDKPDTQCKGCYKFYVSDSGLAQHIERSPLCEKWISILEKDDKFSKEIQEAYSVSNDKLHGILCNSCKTSYSNLGNLNKHLEKNVVCKKIMELEKRAMYKKLDEMQGIKGLEPAEDPIRDKHAITPAPSESKLIHIIWNVFLTDKTQVENIDKEISMNNIKYMICILPDKDIYEKIKPKKEIEHCIIEYNDHNPIITNSVSEKYEECFNKIEHFQGNRENTIIFCNSGYQRSLPFICKYLTSRHKDEVPDVGKALDIILSQVDKENYAFIKTQVKENLLMLRKEDMNSFL